MDVSYRLQKVLKRTGILKYEFALFMDVSTDDLVDYANDLDETNKPK